MNPALAALDLLREGNRRFVDGVCEHAEVIGAARRRELVEGQDPVAIVLGCSDSRVPTELIFDQGLGDLFVIRVAGNVVAPSQVASVEFAAAAFGTRLVVVLGHSDCGAVGATLTELRNPAGERSASLRSIVDRIAPSVRTLVEAEPGAGREVLMPLAVRANIRASVQGLSTGSPELERLIRDEGLLVVGAEYSLATGRVEFLDAPAGPGTR